MTLTSFTDDNTLTMAMQNGEIDAIAMPSASARATLAQGDYQVFSRTTSRADFIRMNMQHEVIQNDAVRTAVAYASIATATRRSSARIHLFLRGASTVPRCRSEAPKA